MHQHRTVHYYVYISLYIFSIVRVRFCFFNVLLTVHRGSVLVNNQLDAQFFFHIYLFQFSTCFEDPCAHHQENQLY